MEKTLSPWIAQLARVRPAQTLSGDYHADIAIVGGGIAGVMTAYYVLTRTPYSVVLLESGLVGHGATGHNAGQIVSYFERPLGDIALRYGVEMATDAQSSIEGAWGLLEEIVLHAHIRTPIAHFMGYAGLADWDHILQHLEDNRVRVEGGIAPEGMYIAESFADKVEIPARYAGLYTVVPGRDVLELLETTETKYVAALCSRKGCTNSALLTEELVRWCQREFASRFSFFEHAHIEQVLLEHDQVRLDIRGGHTATVERVVLCTNGFSHFSIVSNHARGVDTRFHDMVEGTVGYMAGYTEALTKHPVAISYFDKQKPHGPRRDAHDVYFYLTRRVHEMDGGMHNLICIGGPEHPLENKKDYDEHSDFPDVAHHDMNNFLKKTYKHTPRDVRFQFLWHGLMGYTDTGIRCVGEEPCDPRLLYNLGCNGVGILPSIYGAYRISQIIGGEELAPSIFDPFDRTCALP